MTNENPSYCKILIRQLPRTLEDDVTSLCFEFGAEGVSENLAYVQPELRYDPTLVETPTFDLESYFLTRPSEEFQIQLQAMAPAARVELSMEENKDWLEEWKKGFVPFSFVDDYWIIPSWLPAPLEAKHKLFIDPGMAFGTGTHETTQLAARLLVNLAKTVGGHLHGRTVLDVGMGTGVLAILSEKLGAAAAVGLDIDPECRRVARENCVVNKTERVTIRDELVQDHPHQYDIVIANIIDGVLLDLQPSLLACRKSQGHMILSGILTDREDQFIEEFLENSGLKIRERVARAEWVGLWLVPTDQA